MIVEAPGTGNRARPRLTPGWRVAALLAPGLLFLLLLAAIEAGVRWRLPHVSTLEVLVRSPHQHADFVDRRSVSIFEGDPLLFWRLKPGLRNVIWDFTLVSTNAHGLRSDRPLGAKRPGSRRLVFVGDSVTFGYRVPVIFAERPGDYDRNARPFPMLVEHWLREANPSETIEAVILAAPGYSSHQGRAWLERDIASLKPDFVTACFGWNDVSLRGAPDSQSMPTGWLRVTGRRLVAGSQALIRLSQWLEARSGSAAQESARLLPRVSREEYVENHLAMARLSRAHGAETVIIGPVYRDTRTAPEEADRIAGHRQALARALRREGVPYLEVAALTESNDPDSQKLFGERIHPNQSGHRVMAEALVDLLAERDLLRGLVAKVPDPTSPALR